MKTNVGNDWQANTMGDQTGYTATATAVSATSVTVSGTPWAVNQWATNIVVMGSAYGIVTSNTSNVLTIDRWYQPAAPFGSAAATPGVGVFVIPAGVGTALYMALTESTNANVVTDTVLTGELTANGLQRGGVVYAHTAGASNFTLSKTFTSTDGTNRLINKYGIFNAATGGQLLFESFVPSPPTVISGDVVTITATITL